MIVAVIQIINTIIFLSALVPAQIKHILLNIYQNVLIFVQVQHIQLIINVKNVILNAKHAMDHMMVLIRIVLHVYLQINI